MNQVQSMEADTRSMENRIQNAEDNVDPDIENLLADPVKKVAILQKLAKLNCPQLTCSGSIGGIQPSTAR